MRLLTFLRFMRQILKKSPADLDWIQRQLEATNVVRDRLRTGQVVPISERAGTDWAAKFGRQEQVDWKEILDLEKKYKRYKKIFY